jgi:hypothetical protein
MAATDFILTATLPLFRDCRGHVRNNSIRPIFLPRMMSDGTFPRLGSDPPIHHPDSESTPLDQLAALTIEAGLLASTALLLQWLLPGASFNRHTSSAFRPSRPRLISTKADEPLVPEEDSGAPVSRVRYRVGVQCGVAKVDIGA